MIEILLKKKKSHSVHKACTLEHQRITSSKSKDNEAINSLTYVIDQ
jgi:hypothetical protein